MDDSHIPIVAPRLYAPNYYNRKEFLVLLLDVVLAKYIFWDFDIGWASSMYDANLWDRTAIGQYREADKLSPYILVGDTAYLCCPWMLAPFKATKTAFRERSTIGTLPKVQHSCVSNEHYECSKVDGESF